MTVNGGDQRWPAMVNGGQRWLTVADHREPLSDHCRTTARTVVWPGQQPGLLHPRIHQKHWTDPGDGGSVGRTSCSPGTDLNFKRAKVTTIKESKDLSSLALDELIGNLKVHEVVTEKDSEIFRGKKERVKSIALKAKKESSDDETSTSESDCNTPKNVS
ncbi:hypothetical protein Tco_1174227 [Tanacetum coccineum]